MTIARGKVGVHFRKSLVETIVKQNNYDRLLFKRNEGVKRKCYV